MTKIKIILNGTEKEIASGSNLLQLVGSLDLDLKKIAIEKNLEIINNSELEKEKLSQGDKIEIVHFIGGG